MSMIGEQRRRRSDERERQALSSSNKNQRMAQENITHKKTKD
jgi:hypothetical protein